MALNILPESEQPIQSTPVCFSSPAIVFYSTPALEYPIKLFTLYEGRIDVSVIPSRKPGGSMVQSKAARHRNSNRSSGRRKIVFGLAAGTVLLVVLAALFVLGRLDAIVKAAIEKYGSAATGTAVRVESVRIRLREGQASFRGLTIGNPAGFREKNAFSLGEIGAGIDLRSVPEKVKVVDEIIVASPEIFAEVNEAGTLNLNVIGGNLRRSAPPAGKEEAGAKSGGRPETEVRLIIRHILFSGGRIHLRLGSGDGRESVLRLPAVEMRNLGAPNGATPDRLTRLIVGELTRRAAAEVRQKAVSAATDRAVEEAGKALRKNLLKGH
jgi:hypothetical protein